MYFRKNYSISYPVWYLVNVSSRHSGQLSTPEVFVVDVVGHFFEVLQVRPDQHVPQRHEVAVLHVFNLKKSSRILPIGPNV